MLRIKAVDTIMLAIRATTVVNTTTGNNGYITIIPNIEIIVHHFF